MMAGTWNTIAIAWATVPAVLFTVLYAYYYATRLKHSREGWHLIAFTGTVAVLLALMLARRLGLWDSIAYQVAVTGATFFAGLLLWQRVWMLWSNRPRRRRARSEPPRT